MKLLQGSKKFPKDMKTSNLIKFQNSNQKQLIINNHVNINLKMKPKIILIKKKL